MKNFLLKIIFTIHVKFIRAWLSPVYYNILMLIKYRGEKPDVWDNIKDLNMEEFHKEIAIREQFEYHRDPLNGFFDFSPRDKNFFFKEYITSGRDCTAWARVWKWYLKHHDIETKEIAMLNTDELFSDGLSAHMVTVGKFEDGWRLFDYRPSRQYEDSIDKVLEHNVVGYDEFIWTEYKDRCYITFFILIILTLLIYF